MPKLSKDDLYAARAWVDQNYDSTDYRDACGKIALAIIDKAIAEAETDEYPQEHYDEMVRLDVAIGEHLCS